MFSEPKWEGPKLDASDWPRLDWPALPGRVYMTEYFTHAVGLKDGTLLLSNGHIVKASDESRSVPIFWLVPILSTDEWLRRSNTLYFAVDMDKWPPASAAVPRSGRDAEVSRAHEAAAPTRPKVVCLCGSSRFVAQMAVMAWELEKGGAIVLSLHLLPDWYPGVEVDHQAEAEGVQAAMDELHKRKIDLADEVLIMNVGGYIGDSTRTEIAYAEQHGKAIRYLQGSIPAPESRA